MAFFGTPDNGIFFHFAGIISLINRYVGYESLFCTFRETTI